MAVYQVPNLEAPHHYAKMVRLRLCSAAILVAKKTRFGGIRSGVLDVGVPRTQSLQLGAPPSDPLVELQIVKYQNRSIVTRNQLATWHIKVSVLY